MKHSEDNIYVITGGPGSGKSTLIEELKAQRCPCFDEVARGIIQEQMVSSGDALPWKNKALFRDLMFEHQLVQYERALEKADQIIFMDRSFPDVIGYSRLEGIEVDPAMYEVARSKRTNSKVFFTPPWKEIYCHDTERKQTWEEAVETSERMIEIYTEMNYELVELPKEDVKARVKFMISCCKKK